MSPSEDLLLREPFHFPRGLIADWYDGPVHGYLELHPVGPVYQFRMVAWDDWQDARIYVLRRVAVTDFAALAAMLGEPLDPARPWQLMGAGEGGEEEEVLSSAGPVEFVVLASAKLATPKSVLHVSKSGVGAQIQAGLRDTPSDADGLCYSDDPFDQWLKLFE